MNPVILKDQFHVQYHKISAFASADLAVWDETVTEDNVTLIKRTFTNRSDKPVTFLPSLSVETENIVSEWFVPSVSYSGNAFGDGMDPKGLTSDGEPWIFPSDHMGIPGCSVVMGEKGCSALFLPPDCVKSASSLEIGVPLFS